MKKHSYQILLAYSFRLLGRKAYTESEIKEKLARRALKIKLADGEVAAKKVIERLKELNYINDDKILQDYFEYRLNSRPQGKFKFLHEMHRRGILWERAAKEWDSRAICEEPLALSLIEKKSRRFKGLPQVLRKKKIASLLAGRGFAPDTIWSILDKVQ